MNTSLDYQLNEIELQFVDLTKPFEDYRIYAEHKTRRTFGSSFLVARHKNLLKLDNFLKENLVYLLTSTSPDIRDKAARCNYRPEIKIPLDSCYSGEADIKRIVTISYNYFGSYAATHLSRGARYAAVTQSIYLHIKDQLSMRDWDTSKYYFSHIRRFANYVKSCEYQEEAK